MPEAQPQSLLEHLEKHRHFERPAVQTEALTLSYGELLDQVDTIATQLRTAGIEAGDRLLVVLPNCAEHVLGVLATIATGAIAVPLDPEAGSGRLNDVVQQTTPRCCLVGEDQSTPPDLPAIRLHIDPASRTAHCSLTGSPSGHERIPEHPEPIAFIRFTSGSTGQAKGVMLTQAQQLWTARTLSAQFGLDADHRELVLASMALSGGWQRVVATLFGGGCIVIGEKPLSVGDLLDVVMRHRIRGFFTPPPLVRMLLASPADKVRTALQDCRSIEIGSAALSAAELQAFLALVPAARVFVHYGLTECSRVVILDTAHYPDRLATVGRAAPGVELRIVDEEGRPLPRNRNGQIFLRGPQLAVGYWRQPDLDRQQFVDGWLATGDYGSLDEDGFVTLLGRRDDMINCGGHCFFPAEAEHALGMPAGVEQYLIAGVPDPRGILQEVPWAFVVPTDTTQWTPRAFLESARSRLPAHMVPRQIVPVPSLPLTMSGKPNRRETVKLYATPTERLPDEDE